MSESNIVSTLYFESRSGQDPADENDIWDGANDFVTGATEHLYLAMNDLAKRHSGPGRIKRTTCPTTSGQGSAIETAAPDAAFSPGGLW
jgi:hypothetical protein